MFLRLQRKGVCHMPRIVSGGSLLLLASFCLCACSTGKVKTSSSSAAGRTIRLDSPKAGNAYPKWDPETSEDVKTTKATADDQALDHRARAHAHFAAGIIHEMNEDADAALDEYSKAALEDPSNETLLLDVTRRFLQKKEPEKALDLLTNAVHRLNASGAVYARLGLVYGHLGKPEQAIAADRTAIAREPQSIAGYQNLFVTLLQSHRQEEALKVLDEAARQVNAGPEFQIGLGELYANYVLQAPSQRQKIRPRAVPVLDRAEQAGVGDAMLRLRMAEAYDVLGAPEKAAALYLELLKKLPDVPAVRDQLRAKLADLYMRVSDRTNAIAQLQAVVKDDPTNPQLYYYLGFLCYGANQPEQAVDYFKKALLLNPDFAEAYYQLALAQLRLNKSKEALDTLEKARSKSPANFLLEFYSGLAWSEQKEYTAALRHFTAAEVIAQATKPELLDREFYFQIGACYERSGDLAHAEEYFEKSLKLSPDWPEACNYLGYMWAEHGTNLDRARQLIERAVKAEPKNAAYLDSLGWVLYKLNQPQQALKHIQQAVDLSEKPDPTLLDHLGDILSALKRTEQAREAWKKSLALEPNEAIRKKLESVPNP